MKQHSRTATLAFAFAFACAILLVACQRAAPPAQAVSSSLSARQACQQRAAAPDPGASASAQPSDKDQPRLKVTTVDGKPYDLAAQCGQWVVVNFWATWCGPCLQEIPDLTAFARKRKDVAVIGLDFEEIEKPELEAFLKQHTPGYPIALIDTYHPPQDFDTPRALPTSYLIGPDGALVHKFLGPITIKELEQQIERAKPAN